MKITEFEKVFSVEELRHIPQFSVEELMYIDHKYPDAETAPIEAHLFEHPVTLTPCVLLEFDNGRRGYLTLAQVEETEERLNATDNRPQT